MELTEIFRIIIPPLVIVGFIAWHFVLPNWSLQRIHKQIPRKSTDELKAICAYKKSDLLIGLVLNELKTRGENLSFACPSCSTWLFTGTLPSAFLVELGSANILRTSFPTLTYREPSFPKNPVTH